MTDLPVRISKMKIIQVNKTPLFDVFLSNGWYNHSRVLVRDNKAKVTSGNPLTKIQLVEVIKTINDTVCKWTRHTEKNPMSTQEILRVSRELDSLIGMG